MEIFKEIADLSNGNPGAATAIIETQTILQTYFCGKLRELEIYGSDIYVLWSDLAGKDFEKTMKLILNCPADILKDACSRQDYSGRELVKKYIE